MLKRAPKENLQSPLAFGHWMVTMNRDLYDALVDLENEAGLRATNDWLNHTLVESGRFEYKGTNNYTTFKA